jgi:hypothetical protein
MDIFYFLFPALGASFIWSYEEIFVSSRNFIAKYFGKIRKPFLCPECSSFWIGFLFCIFIDPFHSYINLYIIDNIFCGLTNFLFFKTVKHYLNK